MKLDSPRRAVAEALGTAMLPAAVVGSESWANDWQEVRRHRPAR